MPDTEDREPCADPFIGRLVRFTHASSLPVVADDEPLMLCLPGWEIWHADRLSVLTDFLVPFNLRKLSISSTAMQYFGKDEHLEKLKAFGQRHGKCIECLHLGDQGNNDACDLHEQDRVLNKLLPFLPELQTLHVGSYLVRRRKDLDGDAVFANFANLFLSLDVTCQHLRHLHIWHDVIFWNDPATMRRFRKSFQPYLQKLCNDEYDRSVEDVRSTMRRVLGRLHTHEGLPPGFAAFLLDDDETEATLPYQVPHIANIKLRPELSLAAASPAVEDSNCSVATTASASEPIPKVAGADVPQDQVPGADVLEDQVDALFAAVERGDLGSVRDLISSVGVSVHVKNAQSRSPLYAATLVGHGPIVEFLLQNHAEDNGAAFLSGNAEMRRIFTAHGYGKNGKATLLRTCNAIGTAPTLCSFLMKKDLFFGELRTLLAKETLTDAQKLYQWQRVVFMVIFRQGIDTDMRHEARETKLLDAFQHAVVRAPEALQTRANWRSILHLPEKSFNRLPCPAYPKTIAIMLSEQPSHHATFLWKILDDCLMQAPHDQILRVRLKPVLPLPTVSRALEKAVGVTLHKGVPEPICYISNQDQSDVTAAREALDYSVPGTHRDSTFAPVL